MAIERQINEEDIDDGRLKIEKTRTRSDDYTIFSKRSVLFLREHTFLKRDPVMTTCPNCLCGIETIIERRNTIKTHLSALLLLPICLCILPYYSKVLRETLHRCPTCKINLGSNFASTRVACFDCFGEHRNDDTA